MCRRTLTLMILTGLLAVFGLAVGSALFVSSATVTNNEFGTGSVILTTNPTSALVTYAGMVPGDSVTHPLLVTNEGTLALRYAMTSNSTNPDGKSLAQSIQLAIKSDMPTCDADHFAADGTLVYFGALANAAFGDPAVGPQPGDRVLDAGVSESLCFQASLPVGTSDDEQVATTTATFTFQAEQTKNNGQDGQSLAPTAAAQPTQCLGGVQGQVSGLLSPASASLTLLDMSHHTLGTASTDASGRYAFSALAVCRRGARGDILAEQVVSIFVNTIP